jgi:hypothetical protein
LGEVYGLGLGLELGCNKPTARVQKGCLTKISGTECQAPTAFQVRLSHSVWLERRQHCHSASATTDSSQPALSQPRLDALQQPCGSPDRVQVPRSLSPRTPLWKGKNGEEDKEGKVGPDVGFQASFNILHCSTSTFRLYYKRRGHLPHLPHSGLTIPNPDN